MFGSLFSPEHAKRYECEFRFIPNMLPVLYSGGIINDDIMGNPSTWKNYLGPKFNIDPNYLDKLSVIKKELNKGGKKFLITFPTPKVATECFFGILYFDANKKSKYYTLEKEMDIGLINTEGIGIICGQEGSSHSNYGIICKTNLDDFEKCVKSLYKEE